MCSEKILNKYYNESGCNRTRRIGYVMSMIRNLSPLTQREWRYWYLSNIHGPKYLHALAIHMCESIPDSQNITVEECEKYIYDVMFRRTFNGYNKEKKLLRYLQKNVFFGIKESPAEWDSRYFVDFYAKGKSDNIVGIQVKPESFSKGKYEEMAEMERKVKDFKKDCGGEVVLLEYGKDYGADGVVISNMSAIEKLRNMIRA